MSYLVKLVRDKVPALLLGNGTLTYRPVSPEEHVKLLRAKLVEEVAEYLTDPSAGELADVYEAVYALALTDPAVGGWKEMWMARNRKYGVRGGFEEGMGMYAAHPSDPVKWDG